MDTSTPVADRRTPYVETFDDGHGGWSAWKPALEMPCASDEATIVPEIREGALWTRSPWWVDSNHAPPGAGYLHLLAFLVTHRQLVTAKGSPNAFVDGGYSRDLRDARLTVRLRGDVDMRGAELLLLVQAEVPGTTANLVLSGQPIPIRPDWADTTLRLTTDPSQWTCLGARHDLQEMYGCAAPETVLRDVNVDLILVLFPLTIVPTESVTDLHLGRPHRRVTADSRRSGDRPTDAGYEVDWAYLPEGHIEIDTIRIDYPTQVD